MNRKELSLRLEKIAKQKKKDYALGKSVIGGVAGSIGGSILGAGAALGLMKLTKGKMSSRAQLGATMLPAAGSAAGGVAGFLGTRKAYADKGTTWRGRDIGTAVGGLPGYVIGRLSEKKKYNSK